MTLAISLFLGFYILYIAIVVFVVIAKKPDKTRYWVWLSVAIGASLLNWLVKDIL